MGFHKDQNEANMHEPKGATTAAVGQVYVADGLGSGNWQPSMGNRIVIINSLLDMPTPVAGAHVLELNTTYVFSGAVVTSDYLDVSAGGIVLTAFNPAPLTLRYTGTGSMFVGVDAGFSMHSIHVTCPTAQLFNLSETGGGGTNVLTVDRVQCDQCTAVGTLNNLQVAAIESFRVLDCAQGLKYLGTSWASIRVEQSALISTSTTFVGIDITGAVSASYALGFTPVGGTGSIGIKADAASANVTAGNVGIIEASNFSGVTTPLVNISVDDIRWVLQNNSITPDTMPDAMTGVTANAVATVVAGVSTPTKVLGTFTCHRASQFSCDATGRITYDGERPLTVPIDATLTVNPVTGTNKFIRAYLAINGAVVVGSGKAIRADNGNPLNITLLWQTVLNATDYVEIWVENETDAVNITVIDAILRAR